MPKKTIIILTVCHRNISPQTPVSQPLFQVYLLINEARDDGVAVASAEPYANHLHLTPDRQSCQHLVTHFFTGHMLFLMLNQQCQSTEGNNSYCLINCSHCISLKADATTADMTQRRHVVTDTHAADVTGVSSLVTSFTLPTTAASNLARVTTDVWFDLTTAADNGSGRTSMHHNNTNIDYQTNHSINYIEHLQI